MIANAARVGGEVVVNFVLPYAIFSYLQPTQGDVHALMASSVPPIVWSLIEVIWKRRVDAISLLVLAGIALGLLAFLGGGSAKFLQLRENLATAIVGVAFLISAAIRKPIIYEIVRVSMMRKSSASSERFAYLKDRPRFRHVMYVLTVVWGFGILGINAVACVLVFTLSIKQYLIVSPIVTNALFVLFAAWTFWFSKRQQAIGERAS